MDNANDIAHTIDPRKRIVISAILLILDFICLMSQTMMVTALPVIQSDMHQATVVNDRIHSFDRNRNPVSS